MQLVLCSFKSFFIAIWLLLCLSIGISFQYTKEISSIFEPIPAPKYIITEHVNNIILEIPVARAEIRDAPILGKTNRKLQPKIPAKFLVDINNESPNEEMKSLKSSGKKRTAILLVTRWRSGSTLAGEMFNRNSDILYYFEPLAVFANLTSNIIIKQKIHMLNETFNCKAPRAEPYAKYVSTDRSEHLDCLRQGICMSQLSSRFCHPPFCHANYKHLPHGDSPKSCRMHCAPPEQAPLKYKLLESVCRNISTVAVKVIRIGELNTIKPLYMREDVNFKVLFLIRDPRSLLRSRKSIFHHEMYTHPNVTEWEGRIYRRYLQGLEEECDTAVSSYQFAKENGIVRAKTLFVRYEDLALDPIDYSKKIYKKFEMDYTDEVSLRMQSALGKNYHFDKTKLAINYATARDMDKDQIINRWRFISPKSMNHMLTEEEIYDAQRVCATYMTTFGYYNIHNEKYRSFFEIRLDFNVSTINLDMKLDDQLSI